MDTENVIYHLTPAEYFNTLSADKPYLPREFDRDGFIHCTKGEERLLLVADTIYRRVPGDFLLLVIDERKVTCPVKYENVGGIMFPHIYGALNREAIVRSVTMGRRADGTFLPIGEPDATAEHAQMTEAWLAQARVEQLIAESAELRARTTERIAQLERAIAALQTPVTPGPARPAQPVAPAAPVAVVAPSVPSSTPTLETRVAQLEAEVSNVKSQMSTLNSLVSRLVSPMPKQRRAAAKRVTRRKSKI